ncbi:MAG TPA: glycosyltransferase [Bryobacteraceae bacterium]
MARFLFTVWPFAGHIHPGIAVARALRARSHEVAFYTGGAVRSTVEGEGFKFFPFQKVDEERVAHLASSEFPYSPSRWQRLRSAGKLQARFREWLLDTVPQTVDDIDAVSSEWRPDVLVCDLAFWSPILVFHEARRIPVAVFSVLAACILPGPDAPFWGQGALRPRNARMRLKSQLQQKGLRWLSTGFRLQVSRMRKRYGLPALQCSVTEFAGQMPLYLVPSTPEYDYERRDLPPSVHYVGPCLWDKPSNAVSPEWLAQLPADRPLVYVTEATLGTTEPFLLKAAFWALKDLPVEVVMTTGKQRNPAELGFGVLPPNVRVEAYVPQSDLLPKTAVMITLGGSGGVLAALAAGVPLVIVPTEWDRPENAQRVVEAGAGLRLAPNRCTPERLRAAVERVLNEPVFRENAQRLARAFARYGGPAQAAQLLEDLSCAQQPASEWRRNYAQPV